MNQRLSSFSRYSLRILLLGLISITSKISFADESMFSQLATHSWAYVANNDTSSNSAVFVGTESALVVDPGFLPSTATRLFKDITKITHKPIRWVVLTHWHPDHVLAIVCQKHPGITIISSAFTRQQIKHNIATISKQVAASMKDGVDKMQLANCALDLPSHLVNDNQFIDLGEHKIQIFSVPKSHTQGDLVVYSPLDKTLATGDLFLRDSAPSTDGGNLSNLVKSLSRLIPLAPSKVVPGHFSISQVDDLRRFQNYIQAQLAHATRSLTSGLTEQQSVDSAHFELFKDFSQYPQYQATFKDNARAAYRQLSRDSDEN